MRVVPHMEPILTHFRVECVLAGVAFAWRSSPFDYLLFYKHKFVFVLGIKPTDDNDQSNKINDFHLRGGGIGKVGSRVSFLLCVVCC